jgi:predicted CoA-binding protein
MADREKLIRLVRAEAWAVVGASEDRSKFGNITSRELKSRGKKVFPVNPKAGEAGARRPIQALPPSPTARLTG